MRTNLFLVQKIFFNSRKLNFFRDQVIFTGAKVIKWV